MKTPLRTLSVILALVLGTWAVTGALNRQKATPSSTGAPAEAMQSAPVGKPGDENLTDTMQPATSCGASQDEVSGQVLSEPQNSQATVAPFIQSSIVAQGSVSGASREGGWTTPVTSAPRKNGLATPSAAAGVPRSTGSSTSGTGGIAGTSAGSRATSSAGSPAITGASVPGTSPGSSGSESTVLEVDPGVPLPAALLPADEESRSPTVAAAQQQIADSFVQEVDAALSAPETATSDAAVNDAYFDSLNAANEQYRALYGEAAYNQKTMQATLEAMNSD